MGQTNRGKEPSDDKLFGSETVHLKLKDAVEDLGHLMGRGYAQKSALALIGNRYKLNVRQQKAVQGMAASAEQVAKRKARSLQYEALENEEVVIDGFNVLILLESFLSGAYLFKGADGFYRDLSSVHGSYKKVTQTSRAIELVGEFYESTKIKKLHWYFDKPVSNSGKLKKLIEEMAMEKGNDWQVSLTFQTDADIVNENKISVSSDAWILDNSTWNFNFLKYIVGKQSAPNIIDLTD
ncbi:DUF434 domain-containing protein [Fluviicola taffensis]|uniref:DUF434 domain-containing protein n=1 Tax=Fluviicola taffensis (strain DSM 16823 / NCIMB 13979 / RW262) TaxID=755732 RepID=F2IB69_FLUTR|nr:DUF434 domain-containing protein [Fluviicola taffensis]AEA42152.1 protein of unknown function DUF434 [Fluviicola taffensis DSM 16823]